MKFLLTIAFLAVTVLAGGNHGGGGGDGGYNGGNNGGGHNGGGHQSYDPCTDHLYPVALCCSTDAVGVLGVDCKPVTEDPCDRKNFDAQCAKSGRQAKCCLASVLNQAVLCTEPAH